MICEIFNFSPEKKKQKTPKHFIAQILLRCLTQESPLELSLDPSDYLDDESDDDGSASCGSLQLMAVDVPAPHGPVMLLGDRFLRRLVFFFVCAWRIIPVSKLLITMVSKSPN